IETPNFNAVSTTISFVGPSFSSFNNSSTNTYIDFLYINKSSSNASVTYSGVGMTVPSIFIADQNKLLIASSGTIVTKYITDANTGSSTDYGLKCNSGTIEFSLPGQAELNLNGPGNYFNNMTVNNEEGLRETQYLTGPAVVVKGDFNLLSGAELTFFVLEVGGDWTNLTGDPDIYPHNVWFTGKTSDTTIKNNQNFSIVSIDTGDYALSFASGVEVRCHSIYVHSGGVDMDTNAHFIVELSTSGSYGNWSLSHPEGKITIGSVYDPFYKHLNISAGTLTLPDGYFHLDSGSTAVMSGGTIVCKNIYIFSYDSDFQPTGGTVKLVSEGHVSLVDLSVQDGSWLPDLIVQADIGTTYRLRNDLTIKGDFILESGEFSVLDPYSGDFHTMYVAGNWINNSGHDNFLEGEGAVVFNGSGLQTCTNSEEFYTLEVNKPEDSVFRVESLIPDEYVYINCENYDWTAGVVEVKDLGVLSINKVLNPNIMGSFWCHTDGEINITAPNISLDGEIHLHGGEISITATGNGANKWIAGEVEITEGRLIYTNYDLWIPSNSLMTTNISGGTIEIAGGFSCQADNFNPSGGSIIIVGDGDLVLDISSTNNLHNLIIDLAEPGSSLEIANPYYSVLCNGNIDINQGYLIIAGILHCMADINVNADGTLDMPSSASLKMNDSSTININDGGSFKSNGVQGSPAAVTGLASNHYYNFNVHSGGKFEATQTKFENLGTDGLYFESGSNCVQLSNSSFSTGIQNGTLITIDNEQNLTWDSIQFPRRPAAYQNYRNVRKSLNQGSVIFTNYYGVFSGAAYEDDLHGLIFWTGSDVDFIVDRIIITQSDEYVCGIRTSSARVKNIGTQDYVGDIRVDFYPNSLSAPAAGTQGSSHGFISNLEAGKTKFVSFPQMSTDIAGTWTAWARVDTHNDIVETDETNNLSEPQTTTWSPLPPVGDIQISKHSDLQALMAWDYGTPYSRFKIWANDDPNFPPQSTVLLHTVDSTPEVSKSTLVDLSPQKRFFRITAERDLPDLQ
ncbi:MAG: hypothetical protein GX135_02885, partial [Candidatus Cloacimonetes bacterium]|nr:hypothetical protein [Candidatus Cloacimonadota bacterium]